MNWADATIADLLDHAVESNPDGTAVVSGSERLSYRELSETVEGRLKDMLKPSGFNVSALEVEEAICSLQGVRCAAVVGVPDRKTMEAVFAFVTTDDAAGADIDADAVQRHCARHLAKFKVPKYVEFLVGDLPRNDLSKVLKAPLKNRALHVVTSAEARE